MRRTWPHPDAWRLGEYDVRKTEDGVRTQVTLGDGTRLTGRGRGMVAALADALATSLGVSITVEGVRRGWRWTQEPTRARWPACERPLSA